ncbi:MAG: acyl-CoA thioesterase [Rikenellaceae bacterium]|nr:acyl-CoA thioesterase [Rikenellaceae bacterium]
MIVREVKLRVRYKETDNMGIVHHSNYVNYYEVARTEMLREFGTTYRTMEERGVMLPVLEVGMHYYHPAHYDDLLTIRITLPRLPMVKMQFDHEIYNEAGELINTGTVVLAFVDSRTRRPCRAPSWFTDLLAPHFVAATK